MNPTSNYHEISAEMLLGYLYPELENRWIARFKGTFYRNYNNDTLSIDAQKAEVSLARDGFLKLLPQGLLTAEDELKGKDPLEHSEALQKRMEVLREATIPIDTFFFTRRLKIERQIAELLQEKNDFIIEKYFGIKITEDMDPYVKKAVYLLPGIKNYRGDMNFIRAVMESVLGCPVEMKRGRYSGTDNTVSWLPMVRYNVIVPGLDAEGYKQKVLEIKPFCNFLLEWFIPVDLMCIFRVKEKSGRCGTANGIVLDYNVDID